MRRRKQVEEQMHRRLAYSAEHDVDVFWIDVRWLDALGHDRVQAIIHEYGYGDLQSTLARTKLGALQKKRA